MIYSIQREPLRKSLPTVIDRSYGIQTYDEDNIYPQRVDEVREGSYTAKTAVNRFADFIDGEGWQDPVLANLILNSEGQTANDILDIIALDKSPYTGFALHFKYNPFTFKVMEITPVEFMFCRLGLPDSNGNVSEIVYSRNWELDFRKTVDMVMDWEYYPVFNPDPLAVKAQIEECGWDNYPGQILYWTPKPGVYPKCRFHSVLDDAQSQSELGVYKLSNIQNKWTTETIIGYPGKFEDAKKEQEIKDKLAEHKGSRGSGILVIENPTGEKLDVHANLEIQNTDKLFEFTSKDVKNAIREAMGLPAEIMGTMPESGMFNQTQIQDAYTYTNSITRNDRNHISRVFKKIMPYWKDVVNISSYDILPQQYTNGASTGATGTPVQPGQVQSNGQPTAQAPRVVDKSLSKLSAGEQQTFDRILNKFKKGKYTRELAATQLKMIFGFTDEEIKSFIP